MKWKDVLTLDEENQRITFTQSGVTCSTSDIIKSEVITAKVQKEVAKEILNSIANAFTDSVSNGQEYMKVHVRVTLANNKKEDIVISKERVIRFSDAFNEDVKIARKIQARIKELKK